MNTLEIKSNQLVLRTHYSRLLVDIIKTIPGHRWNPVAKTWSFPLNKEILSYVEAAIHPLNLSSEIDKYKSSNNEKDIYREKISVIKKKEIDVVKDYQFKTHPFRHQKICFNFLKNLNEGALFLEMGTGKTKIIIDIITYHLQKKNIKNFLYIAPVSTLENIQNEFKIHSPLDIPTIIVSGNKKRKISKLESKNIGYILNYESLRPLMPNLMKINWDCIICDESTRIKTSSSQRSKACHILGNRSKYKYAMTGTPVTESLIDIYSQYKFLDSNIYGPSFFAFKTRYAVMGGFEDREIIGYKNIDELKEKMFKIAIQYSKKDCIDLPNKIYETQKFELNPQEKEMYEEMKKNLIIFLESGEKVSATILLTKMLRLSQITSGFLKTENGKEISIKSPSKFNLLTEIIEDILPNKIVIWCRFRYEIFTLQNYLQKKKISFVSLFGDTPQNQRDSVVKKFNEDKNCNIFIGQPKTGGLGINLVSSHYVIFCSNNYSLEERLQAEDRNHRIGQTNKVTYIDLLAKDTIDESLYTLLRNKKKISESFSREEVKDFINGKS